MESVLLDAAGRRRSPATLPGHHGGRPPRKGLRYPADPPTIEEIVAVVRRAGDHAEGLRLRGLIIVLWRARLRISEVLALVETGVSTPIAARFLFGAGREASAARSAWTNGHGTS